MNIANSTINTCMRIAYYFRFDQNYTAGILQLTPLSGKSAVLGMSEYSNTQKKVPTS